MTDGSQTKLQALAELLRAHAGSTAVLTGAGISVDSGIPDFRTPGQGLWTRMDPMELSVEALRGQPERFFQRCLEVFAPALNARPNRGHQVLAALERMGFVFGLITQNIDGLHQAAGSQNVVEVHGNLRNASCMDCHRTYPLEELLHQLREKQLSRPQCSDCGGILRPDVTLFGDAMPPDFGRGQEMVASCSLLLVVGSSLEVSPVNSLPALAPQVAVVNLDATPWDRTARLYVRGNASELLSSLLEMLGGS